MKLIFFLGSLWLFTFSHEKETTIIKTHHTSEILNGSKISGTINLPATNSSPNRRFRGSAYRNRGNTATTGSESTELNPYTNTIISLHPTSFDINELKISDSVQIIQRDAIFIPQVTPVTVGSTVQFVNDDTFFHNVFSLTPGAKFNIGRRPTGDVYSKEVPPTRWKVSGLGPIDLFCDIHSQMNAIILSLDTPFFTRSNEDGTFSINDLPSGTYELRVYNRNFELYTEKITVRENEQYEVNINVLN
ncbi:MAG: carboxypeptidase regulatory-like domain-containing protein [Balneolaceae bacterium]